MTLDCYASHDGPTVNYIELEFAAELQGERRELPPFLGPTLRGAFGFLLKRTVCQVQHGMCDRCLLATACPYPAVFEGLPSPERELMRKYPRIPQPFVLTTPFTEQLDSDDRLLKWSMRLFGGAARYWPYVVHVFRTACEEGLGRRQVQARIQSVTDSERNLVWSGDDAATCEPRPQSLSLTVPEFPEHCELRWRFHSPVQIVQGGHGVGTQLGGLDLLLAGRRRWELMQAFYGAPTQPSSRENQVVESDSSLEAASPRFEHSDFVTRENRLRHFQLARFSGRQQRRMELHGTVGEIVIAGPWGRVGNWLHAASLLHVGKSVTFGFGAVTWEIA